MTTSNVTEFPLEIGQIEKIFNQFVRAWCKGDLESNDSISFPNAKERTFNANTPKGKVIVTNIHFRGVGNAFTGTVLISLEGVTLWAMNYHGSYPKEIGLFLRECIMDGIATGQFLGGRGPHSLSTNKYIYHNSTTVVHGYESFTGREEIISISTEKKLNGRIGWMEYSAKIIK